MKTETYIFTNTLISETKLYVNALNMEDAMDILNAVVVNPFAWNFEMRIK